jgi:hypothetical protein
MYDEGVEPVSGDADTRSRDQQILAFFCRHLIGICWYEGKVNARGDFVSRPAFRLASGFLLRVHGRAADAVLVTAGHVVSELKARLSKPSMQARHFRLFDTWGPEATSTEPLPFDLLRAPHAFQDDTELGLDYAFIALPELVLRALAKTVTPFKATDWRETQKAPFDFYAMVGAPSDLTEQQVSMNGGIDSITSLPHPVLMFLHECPPPADSSEPTIPQFYGQLNCEGGPEDIAGMSGGPLLGFRKTEDSQLRYWPVAIQSRWLPRQRIVIGTPLPVVAAQLEQHIDRFAGG